MIEPQGMGAVQTEAQPAANSTFAKAKEASRHCHPAGTLVHLHHVPAVQMTRTMLGSQSNERLAQAARGSHGLHACLRTTPMLVHHLQTPLLPQHSPHHDDADKALQEAAALLLLALALGPSGAGSGSRRVCCWRHVSNDGKVLTARQPLLLPGHQREDSSLEEKRQLFGKL